MQIQNIGLCPHIWKKKTYNFFLGSTAQCRSPNRCGAPCSECTAPGSCFASSSKPGWWHPVQPSTAAHWSRPAAGRWHRCGAVFPPHLGWRTTPASSSVRLDCSCASTSCRLVIVAAAAASAVSIRYLSTSSGVAPHPPRNRNDRTWHTTHRTVTPRFTPATTGRNIWWPISIREISNKHRTTLPEMRINFLLLVTLLTIAVWSTFSCTQGAPT